MRRLLGVLRTDDRDASAAAGRPPSSPTPLASTTGPAKSRPGGRERHRCFERAPDRLAPGAHPRPARPDESTSPQPDSADLESLVAQVRDSGLRISLVRMGTPVLSLRELA
ncbi:hypothetical protein NKG05_20680 [Oerskovia sp. M15]